MLAPEVLCHIGGRSPLAGDLEGRDAVLGLLRRLADVSGGTYRIAANDVLANDRHVVVLEEHSCVVDGARYDGLGVTVGRVRDGLATELWVHAADPYGADAFRSMVALRTS